VKTIEVKCDFESGSLLVPDPVLLPPDEDLRWLFVGIPNDSRPSVIFETAPFTGPFLSLCHAPNRLIGHGRQRLSPSTHQYTLQVSQVVDGLPTVVLQSPVGTLSTESLTDRLPTMVTVTYLDGEVNVEPEALSLSAYDTVFWRFVGLPKDWYPEILFTGGPQGLLNSSLGPFLSLTFHIRILIGNGDDQPSEILAYGSGNNGSQGAFPYLIMIRDSDNQTRVIKPVDPALDNRGDPPGG
jgi:hypothetical protein